MKAVSTLLTALLAFGSLAGCNKQGAKTTVPLAWKNPSFEGQSFKKLFVIGVGENDGARRLFEDTFAKAIAAQGAAAQASWGALPKSERLSEDEVRAAIEGGNFDGVIITRLLNVSKDTEYVPPSTYTVPRTYYGYGYYGYYGSSYDVVHQPGYYKTNTVFLLETNLYATDTAELVWSGRSDTVNPENLKEVIDSMTAAVAQKLANEGLLPR